MMSASTLPAIFAPDVITNVHQGDCLISDSSQVTFSTLLGSCISACVRDTEARVGGMNHFLLASPSGSPLDRYGAPARYGAFAMEQLINGVLSQGTGLRANLEIKVFGGGITSAALSDIGAKNIQFLREFLANEGYVPVSADLGGAFARRVLFKPCSGQAFVKRLDSTEGDSIAREELTIARSANPAPRIGVDVELF